MKKIALLSLFLMICALRVSAQLEVSVSNLLYQKPIANYKVYVDSRVGGFLDSATTNKSGIAVFNKLETNQTYRVFTKATEQLERSETQIVYQANQKVALSVPIRQENALEEVVVTDSRAARLNTLNAEVSAVVTRRELRELPIEGRDVTRSLVRLPNLSVASLGYAEAPNVAINGLNGGYTNYLIDGMDNNERFLGNMKFNTPVGFTEGVTVLTNNYSVEYGNTTNGVVNMTTRSGSNTLSGEAFYLTRPGAVVDAPSKYATLDLSGNQVKDGFQRHQVGFGLGGALKKDKTFFYVNFEQTYDKKDNLLNVPQLGVNEVVTGRNSFSYFSTKIDQIWNNRFKSSLRVNVGSFDIQRQGGGLEGGILFPSGASTQANRTYNITLKNTYVLSPNLTAETNFQHSYFRWNYRQPDNPTSISVTVQDPTGTGIAILGQSGAIFDNKEFTQQFQQKFIYRKNRHTFKAGVEFTTSDFALLGGGNSYGTYTVRINQAQLEALKTKNLGAALDVKDIPAGVAVRTYDVELRPTTFGARQNVFNVYFEDMIGLTDRLKATIGLRYDYDNLTKGGGKKGDLNNLAPRLSLNYEASSKWVVRGGYGIFYDKIKYSIYSDALQFSSTSVDYKKQLADLQRLGLLDRNADLNAITFAGNIRATSPNVTFPNGPASDQLQSRRDRQFNANLRVLNPNGYQNPLAHHFSLGTQFKPTPLCFISIDLVHVATNNLYVLRNLNPATPYTFTSDQDVKVRTVAQADLTRPVPIRSDRNGFYAVAQGDTLRGIARNVFMTENVGYARYSALNVVLNKLRGPRNYAYRIGYTISSIMSNTGGINTRAQDSNNFDADYGPDDNDRRHVLNAMFYYYPIKNLVIAPAFLLQSGMPVSYVVDAKQFGTTDLNGDSESFGFPSDLYPGVARNSGRLPWAKTLDLSIRYTINVKQKPSLEFTADIFNVLNTQNESGFNSTKGASNQFQLGPAGSSYTIRGASPPRQFQFGLRYLL